MHIEPIHFIPPEPKLPFDPREAAEDCQARAGIYRLLASVFAEEASSAFLDALRQPDSLAALAEIGLHFDADFTTTALAELEDVLACEYATLFASPGGATPVESVRLTGRMQQEPFYEAQADYQRLGFVLQAGRFSTVEDHLGAELELVATLLEQAAAAAEAGDEATFRRMDREIKRFWTVHLGRWVRGYAKVVERATEHSFYREMARLLHAFGTDEISRMKLKVEDVDGRPPEQPKPETEGLGGCGGGMPEATRELPASLL